MTAATEIRGRCDHCDARPVPIVACAFCGLALCLACQPTAHDCCVPDPEPAP